MPPPTARVPDPEPAVLRRLAWGRGGLQPRGCHGRGVERAHQHLQRVICDELHATPHRVCRYSHSCTAADVNQIQDHRKRDAGYVGVPVRARQQGAPRATIWLVYTTPQWGRGSSELQCFKAAHGRVSPRGRLPISNAVNAVNTQHQQPTATFTASAAGAVGAGSRAPGAEETAHSSTRPTSNRTKVQHSQLGQHAQQAQRTCSAAEGTILTVLARQPP